MDKPKIQDASNLGENPEENQGCLGSKSQFTCRVISVVVSRLIFIAHALLLIWRITVIFGTVYWFAALGFLLVIIDVAIIFGKRKGNEWKW